MWVGIFLICVGILVVLSNMNILRGNAWDYVVPVFFILLGGSMIIKRSRRKKNESPQSDEYSDTRREDDIERPTKI